MTLMPPADPRIEVSIGTQRLRNRDMIELFDLVPAGTPVWIGE